MTVIAGGAAAASSARRPSGRMSGVPQRLQDITDPDSVHFQQVGQQTFMTTAHSHQRPQAGGGPSTDGARTVTGSALIEIPAAICAQRLVTALRIRTFVALMTRTLGTPFFAGVAGCVCLALTACSPPPVPTPRVPSASSFAGGQPGVDAAPIAFAIGNARVCAPLRVALSRTR